MKGFSGKYEFYVLGVGVAVLVVSFALLYSFLNKPVALPHDVEGVVVRKFTLPVSSMNKRELISGFYDTPHLEFELVGSHEIVSCEVNPTIYEYHALGDTCVLRYTSGEYVYKMSGRIGD